MTTTSIPQPPARQSRSALRRLTGSPDLRRLVACLAGSLVLAMMVGPQEGTESDYGYSFGQAVLRPRVFVFLALGLVAFAVIRFWPLLRARLARPGTWPFASGLLAVVAALAFMHWYDLVGDAKFGAVADAVAQTPNISFLASAFFAWLAYAQLLVILVAGVAAIAWERRWLAFTTAGLCVLAAIITYLAHVAVVDAGRGADHSLGHLAALFGYLVAATGVLSAALNGQDMSGARELTARVISFRPGLPLWVAGVVATLIALLSAAWFSPQNLNATLHETRVLFRGTALAPIAVQYLIWLGWVLLAVTAVLAAAAVWWRQFWLGLAAGAVGAVGVVLSLVTLYDISALGADLNQDGATGPWQNLGVGGWLACAGLFVTGASGVLAAGAVRTARSVEQAAAADELAGVRDATAPTTSSRSHWTARQTASSDAGARTPTRTGLVASAGMIAIAAALFYPPMATPYWQQVLVSEIGISMLLAIGLNVVVGWAGLLDLGFIAFYAIGSYTTAYLTGSLPVRPPDWLILSPLLAIPFAIVVCLIAGLLLGAPTLRLRGDYLAIVTLGFGEIIRIVAVNSTSITNGSQGPSKSVPNPVLHIGPLHIQWGLNQLQYWYLLLVLIVIIIVLFRRLENSRLGRAWAAVREDEIAAQSNGVNTTRVKLLAFAIGASTSGVAGVFFASQIGSFTPDNFVLQNSILIVAYVVFGGMGSLTGALAGAAMLTWLPAFLRDQVPASDRLMWIGAVVLLMMIFRPQGLLPARRRQAELKGLDGGTTQVPRAVPAGEGM